MTNTFKLIAAPILLSVAMTYPTLASAMRCGTHIISYGQINSPGQYEVLKRCGEPTYRQGNTWIYEQSSSVTKQIRFDRDGRIVDIK